MIGEEGMIVGILASTLYYCRDSSIWLPVVMPVFCKLNVLASLPNPPVADGTSGVKVACSISLILCS